MDVSSVFMADILPMWQSAASAHLCCEWALFDPLLPVVSGTFREALFSTPEFGCVYGDVRFTIEK